MGRDGRLRSSLHLRGMNMAARDDRSQRTFAYSALMPIFAIYLVLRCWPILQSFYLSFTNYSLTKRIRAFVGLDNYVHLLTKDRDFAISLRNTLAFALLTTVVVLALAFLLALVMHRHKIIGAGFLQTVFFLPVVISVVPCAIIWKWIYDPQYGILNFLLSKFGIASVGWLVDKRFSVYSISAFVIWKWVGYYMVMFWVGLKGIPAAYSEAASVDGANGRQVTRHILVPLLRPILLLALVMATINGFTIFSEIYVMTVGSQGAPGNVVKVLTYDIYERGFLYYRMGQANAESAILFLIILGLTIVEGKLIRKGELY